LPRDASGSHLLADDTLFCCRWCLATIVPQPFSAPGMPLGAHSVGTLIHKAVEGFGMLRHFRRTLFCLAHHWPSQHLWFVYTTGSTQHDRSTCRLLHCLATLAILALEFTDSGSGIWPDERDTWGKSPISSIQAIYVPDRFPQQT
jgi:hypothetical protein